MQMTPLLFLVTPLSPAIVAMRSKTHVAERKSFIALTTDFQTVTFAFFPSQIIPKTRLSPDNQANLVRNENICKNVMNGSNLCLANTIEVCFHCISEGSV